MLPPKPRQPQTYLTVIVPAYNEERRIGACLDRWLDYLWRTPWIFEVLVVANGCTDRTVEIVEQARRDDDHVRWIDQPIRGKGAAVRAGMLAARGEWRYMADADLACPPDQVAQFLATARSEAAPIVIGSREIDRSQTATTLHRRLIGRAFHRLVRSILPEIYVHDTQCGFKLFRADAAAAIFRKAKLDGLAFDAEALYLARRLGYEVSELPIPWTHDPDSRVRLLADSWQMAVDLTRVKRIHTRLWMPRRQVLYKDELPAD